MSSYSTRSAPNFATITAGAGDLSPRPYGIYVDAGGQFTASGTDGNSETFNVTAGQVVPIQPLRITSSTATLIGLYNEG